MSGYAQIGVWWVVGGRVIKHSEPASQVPLVEGWRDLSISHFDYWHVEIEPRSDALAGSDYTDYPRGRVLAKADGSFVVYGSARFVRDQSQQDLVMSAFRLDCAVTEVRHDRQYDDAIPLLDEFDD